jgi:hypothetical protein
MSAADRRLGRGRQARGRVRWARFAIAVVPSLAVSGIILGLTAGGAVASSFSISGQQFEVSADSLTGTGFQQFGTADTVTSSGSQVAVAETEIGSASITNLCQSVVMSLPVVGTVTLRITAGGSTPVTASSLVIDANQLGGSTATFKNISIGQDASTLNEIPGAPEGAAGSFGQQADSITITNLQQTALATTAGTFTLPGFAMSLTSGTNACF